MTTDELMALARDAGNIDRRMCIGRATGHDVREAYEALRAAIEQALAEAREDEREWAAQVCEAAFAGGDAQWIANLCAAAIRKGEKT